MDFDLNYNFYNTLIFSGIIYGLVFSFTILKNKKYASLARNFLILTVISMTLSNLQYWLIDIGFREEFNIPKVYYLQFELLILPFFYLFARKYLKKSITIRIALLVIFPFFIGMLYQILMHLYKIEKPLLTTYNLTAEIITICFSLLLIILVFIDVFHYENKSKRHLLKNVKIETKWLKNTLMIGVAVYVLWILGTQLFYFSDFKTFKSYYPLWIGISIIIYWIGNRGVAELRILKERQIIRKKIGTVQSQNHLDGKTSSSKRIILFEKILNDIKQYRLYLEPDLSLDKVAGRYDISSGYLSQLISKYSKNGFSDMINSFRIESAKQMLSNNSYDSYTIDSIALESGFNTKSNFYSVFKKNNRFDPKSIQKKYKILIYLKIQDLI